MKSLTILLVTTIAAFLIVNAQESEKKTKIQTSDQRDQMEKVFNQIIWNVPNELSTFEKRQEAVQILRKIIEKRILTNARGYEQCKGFQEEFSKTYAKLSEYIEPDISRLKRQEVEELTRTTMKAYEANAEEFHRFYTQNLANDPTFKGMSEAQFIKLTTQLSALLLEKNEKQWSVAFRITYLWPVCRSKHDKDGICSPGE